MGKRVVILGGGMAGLSTAWFLTQSPGWQQEVDRIDLYQMGWRLGGKCASGRGPMRRIEEHGIHLFGGGYYNALPMMRDVFRALAGDDAQGDADFRAAFEPQCTSVRVRPDGLKTVVRFPRNNLSIDDLIRIANRDGLAQWLAAALRGMRAYFVDADDGLGGPQAMLLSGSEPLPSILKRLGMGASPSLPATALARLDSLIASLQAGDLITARELAGKLREDGQGLWPGTTPDQSLPDVVGHLRTTLQEPAKVRFAELILLWSLTLDFIAAVVSAWLDVIQGGTTLQALDVLDQNACLAKYGARPATLQSDLVLAPIRILYQFDGGDPKQPRIAGGCLLHWVLRSFAYAETPFWFFRQGTGETIIRPLYQALLKRGVNFHFFHRVEAIVPNADGRDIAELRFRVQATTPDNRPYEPLDQGQWPNRPLTDQLVDGDQLAVLPPDTLEDLWAASRPGEQAKVMPLGLDDIVVLAMPPATLPTIAPGILTASPAWAAMAASVASVETQSLQLWLDADSNTLGMNRNVSQMIQPDDTGLGAGFVNGFHTFSDFSPLIGEEAWPPHNQPRALWYFSDAMPDSPAAPPLADPSYPARRQAQVLGAARTFMARDFGRMLANGAPPPPGQPAPFDPAHLVVPDPSRATQAAWRLDQQYVRANVQPSERYVQVMPGTLDKRLHAGRDTTFTNLVLAGDWTFNGLNVGCVEATVMSGRIAAASLLGAAEPAAGVPGYLPPSWPAAAGAQ